MMTRFPRGILFGGLATALLLGTAGEIRAQAKPAPANAKVKAAAPTVAAQPAADAKRLKQMSIEKPLKGINLKQDDEKRKRITLKIRKVLRDGVLNDSTRKLIDEWIEWRLYRMTITEIPQPKEEPKPPPPRNRPVGPGGPMPPGGPMDPMGMALEPPPQKPLPPLPYVRRLPDFNKAFLQEIRTAANPKFQPNPALAEAFRKHVLNRIIAKSRDLFDNNFHVRLNVVILLSRLNLVERGFGRKAAVAYAPVSVPLLEILRDDDQLTAVKVAAVLGLRRVLLMGRPDRDTKNGIALELIAQLQKKSDHRWYSMRLVETLGWVNEPLITRTLPGQATPEQKPLHVQALVVAMRDPHRHWIVRSEAAKSLGRVSLHGSVSSALIAHEIVVLCKQMAAAYNKTPNEFYWQQCFLKAYLAFKPLNKVERTRVLDVKPGTLISKFDAQKSISDAYAQILPAVRHILQQPETVNGQQINKPFPDASVQVITAWIKENQPSINRIAPGMPLLEAAEPTAAKRAEAVKPAVLVGN